MSELKKFGALFGLFLFKSGVIPDTSDFIFILLINTNTADGERDRDKKKKEKITRSRPISATSLKAVCVLKQ